MNIRGLFMGKVEARLRLVIAPVAVIALAAIAVPAVGTDDGPHWPPQDAPRVLGAPPQSAEDLAAGADGTADAEALALPPVPEAMHRLASNLSEQFGADPYFSAAEVTEDRSQVIVYWYGDPSSEVRAAAAGEPTVETVFEQTEFLPGELRAAAYELVTSNPAVAAAAALYDGSGIRVSLNASSARARSTDAGIRADVAFPVTFDDLAPTPAYANTRQSDLEYHLGGARITSWNTGGGCTSGFAVVKDDNPDVQGIMFAAHCGAVGEQWVTPDITVTPEVWYLWGETVARDVLNDGGIQDTRWSQPLVWTAEWNSNVYTLINGEASSYIGQEICYSGSYSGLLCGNIVNSTTEIYSLGGDLTAVFGMRTEQQAGLPAVGNGDSGGPGYQLLNTSSGLKRYAVGIISAIPTGSGATCRGVPGGAGSNGRKCSSTVWYTSVITIGNNLGWHVPTV